MFCFGSWILPLNQCWRTEIFVKTSNLSLFWEHRHKYKGCGGSIKNCLGMKTVFGSSFVGTLWWHEAFSSETGTIAVYKFSPLYFCVEALWGGSHFIRAGGVSGEEVWWPAATEPTRLTQSLQHQLLWTIVPLSLSILHVCAYKRRGRDTIAWLQSWVWDDQHQDIHLPALCVVHCLGPKLAHNEKRVLWWVGTGAIVPSLGVMIPLTRGAGISHYSLKGTWGNVATALPGSCRHHNKMIFLVPRGGCGPPEGAGSLQPPLRASPHPRTAPQHDGKPLPIFIQKLEVDCNCVRELFEAWGGLQREVQIPRTIWRTIVTPRYFLASHFHGSGIVPKVSLLTQLPGSRSPCKQLQWTQPSCKG